MLPALAIRLNFEAQRSLAFSSISSSYTAVGSALLHPARQWLLQNLTDETLQFSIDGVTDHFVLPENGFWISDITTNKTVDQGFYLAQGTTLYVKEVGNPTAGSVYFSVIYASD